MKEQNLLKWIQDISRRTGAAVIGDDAAVLNHLVISTDQFIENTHFRWSFQSPKDVGFKGCVQALSDLAAMATGPAGMLVSAAVPADSEELCRELFLGIEHACLEYAVPLLGGDLTRSQDLTYLDFVVLGWNAEPIYKRGARAGDLLAVTGPLGSAKGGLWSLENGQNYLQLHNAFLKPQAKIQTALQLAKNMRPTSLTDISDSLSRSVHDLATHSKCGFTIHVDKIPFHPELAKLCRDKNLALNDFLFAGGEDYQLLMTLPPDSSEKLISDFGLTVIGHATETPENFYIQDGKKSLMTEVGWDPFDL